MCEDIEFLDARDRIILPLSLALTIMWLLSGLVALRTGNVQVFVICSAPFGVMTGYVFGVRILRRNGNGQ